ncbi:hypothetical protein T439DRAFT_99008 [Meredithblackwellia eburnea MCA 4105]
MAFTLTKEHVNSILSPCAEGNWEPLVSSIDPNVVWWIADDEENLSRATGVFNVESWFEKINKPLAAKLDMEKGLRMSVRELEIFGWKAIVECEGKAEQKNGKAYNNRYCWILIFDENTGKIIKIREYLNTALVEEVKRS